jgi:hypothetical protein
MRTALLVAVLLACAPHTAAAQDARADTVRVPMAPLVIPAGAGALLGGFAGIGAGLETGWGGGDDPGLIGALVFGTAGAVLGSALGAGLVARGRIRTGRVLAAGVMGVAGGLLTAVAASQLTNDDAGVVPIVSYGIGHGLFTAYFATVR